MANQPHFNLDSSVCLFCAACASVAPEHFFVDPDEEVARVTKQPVTHNQLTVCRAAMINCPASAITETERAEAT